MAFYKTKGIYDVRCKLCKKTVMVPSWKYCDGHTLKDLSRMRQKNRVASNKARRHEIIRLRDVMKITFKQIGIVYGKSPDWARRIYLNL